MSTESTSTTAVAGPVLSEGLGPAPERDIVAYLQTSLVDVRRDERLSFVLLTPRETEQVISEIESLRAALKWYADGEHFTKSVPHAWDTVSGEPQNWWCDESGTAMVEDGSLAGMVLAGRMTGAQLHALDDGEVVKA